MRKTPYCETIDAVRAPARAVERAAAAALGAAQSGKVISMKQQKRHKFFKPAVIAAGLAVAVAVGGTVAWLNSGTAKENAFVMTVGAAELKADEAIVLASNTWVAGSHTNVVGGGAFAYYRLKVKPEREESKVDEASVRSFEDDGILPSEEFGQYDGSWQ